MDQHSEDQRTPASLIVTGVAYMAVLTAGVVLISTGPTTPAEASLYVAPFLGLHEHMTSRR